jgi:hypothetical protein
MNLHVLYEILRNVAARQSVITYKELSREYAKRTRKKIHWRQWRPHLEDLGDWLASLDRTLPPIAALVVNAQSRMPGKGFFNSARSSRIPPRAYWQAVLHRVYAADWPESI